MCIEIAHCHKIITKLEYVIAYLFTALILARIVKIGNHNPAKSTTDFYRLDLKICNPRKQRKIKLFQFNVSAEKYCQPPLNAFSM
jgi:hypothetical protein